MSPRRLALLSVATLVLVSPIRAAGDPVDARLPLLTLPGPRTLCKPAELATDPPVCRELPPGRFVDEPAWTALDLELRRLQTKEIRIDAENASLRASADGWQPGWRTLAVAFVTGVAGGFAVYHYINR